MKEQDEINQHIEVRGAGNMEGGKKENDLILKNVQDESFMEGYKYAMQILKESMTTLNVAKEKNT